MSNTFVIGLGSSHSRAKCYLEDATILLKKTSLVTVLAQSEILMSGGVGTDEASIFVNSAVCVSSSLNPSALWFEMRAIETRLGRVRTKINAPRTIDLDLLWWSGQAYCDQWVTLPHPRLNERRFARDLAGQALASAATEFALRLQKSCRI